MIATVFLVLPTKAERTTIDVDWTKIYLTQSYDFDDNGRFYIQIKYKDDSGWHVKNSPNVKLYNIEEGYYYPAKSFDIEDVIVNEYVYVRMMESDLLKDDQICAELEMDSGNGINQGSWDIAIYLYIGFLSKEVGQEESENENGDWFYLEIQNLG
ncbi:MAG: hypothetical protein HZR80_16370 [Candidatus Heimdallarchaeota archaeon]